MKMVLPEILQGLVFASSGESGRALTLTCILSISGNGREDRYKGGRVRTVIRAFREQRRAARVP